MSKMVIWSLIPIKCSQVKSPLFVTVNAMYVPSENQIILPISILQEPLFHVSLPAAINFGAMGSIMGHEVVHGFDNTEQKINQSSGKLRNWWNNATVSRFQERAACLVEQYSNYNISGRSIDGKWTLSMILNIFYITLCYTNIIYSVAYRWKHCW